MTFKELVDSCAKKAGCTQVVASSVLRAMVDEISESLTNGEDVQFTGFGSFSIREIKAREGINPKTREKIQIPASKTPTFKAYPAFKKRFK